MHAHVNLLAGMPEDVSRLLKAVLWRQCVIRNIHDASTATV